MATEFWKQMNGGGFSIAFEADVKRFKGKLFADAWVFPMEREDIGVLKAAARKDWREVDPSIFGTLLEQALGPEDRASLAATLASLARTGLIFAVDGGKRFVLRRAA